MNLRDDKNKILFVALFAVLLLVGCGSKKTGSGTTDLGSELDVDGKAVAECSKDGSGHSDFEVRLTAYRDAYGRLMPNFVRMQIKKMPEQFKTENWEINTYRWMADASGNADMDTDKLGMYFQAKYGGQFDYLRVIGGGNVTSPYTRIDFDNEVEPIAQATNVPTETAQSFFNVVSFIIDLKDPTSAFQVLRVSLKKNDGGVMVEQKYVDVLIPTYYANPEVYSVDHAPILQTIHPLRTLTGRTENQYLALTQAWCL